MSTNNTNAMSTNNTNAMSTNNTNAMSTNNANNDGPCAGEPSALTYTRCQAGEPQTGVEVWKFFLEGLESDLPPGDTSVEMKATLDRMREIIKNYPVNV